MNLTNKGGKELINLAKDAIRSNFSNNNVDISEEIKKKYNEERGVFVTLTIDGELRGCIGYPEPVEVLWKAVIDSARNAAFSDPRFGPLTEEEFAKIKIEISVLTNPELIEVDNPDEYLKKIKIGKDGLIIRSGLGGGLLLPQVFTEYKVDSKGALEMVCEKGGLSRDSWKDLSNKIYRFQAQIFSEE